MKCPEPTRLHRKSGVWGTLVCWQVKGFSLEVRRRRIVQFPSGWFWSRVRRFYWSVKGLTGSRIQAVMAK